MKKLLTLDQLRTQLGNTFTSLWALMLCPSTKTAEDTQEVRRDADGKLWTKQGGGIPTIKQGTGTNAEVFNGLAASAASNAYAHAEGAETTASGAYAHAEGARTSASGGASHAEGHLTTASGDISHAEGNGTAASGDYSHAEGGETTASGAYAHAGGSETTAEGLLSFAHGKGVKARSENQTVFGKYNYPDPNGVLGFMIGSGNGTSSKSNAFGIKWTGDVLAGGDFYAGVQVQGDVAPSSNNRLVKKSELDAAVGNIEAALNAIRGVSG